MARVNLGSVLGAASLDHVDSAEVAGAEPAHVEALGNLAGEALQRLEELERISPGERWFDDVTRRSIPNDLMRTAAVLDAVAQRISGDDGDRIQEMQRIVKKYAQLEAMVVIRSSDLKA